MKIVICPDSFKGSCRAREAAAAIADGVRAVLPHAHIVLLPLADGGEGTLETLCAGTDALHTARVHDPLMRPITARWGCLPGGTAVVETAEAAGLTLLHEHERDPLCTTTFGAGELIRAALEHGCTRVLIGLGGSATNDGGAGMAQALGVRFHDRAGRVLKDGVAGGTLRSVARIDAACADARITQCVMRAACDVRNPLCGPHGAAAVFAPQKGADPAAVALLDAALASFADVIQRDCGMAVRELPGAGAAGGLGAGCVAFLRAQLVPGIEMILDAVHFDEQLKDAALVITGEGRIDAQSAMGKVLSGVLRHARQAGVPVMALAGVVADDARLPCPAYGIVNHGVPAAEACAHAAAHLARLAARVMRELPRDVARG